MRLCKEYSEERAKFEFLPQIFHILFLSEVLQNARKCYNIYIEYGKMHKRRNIWKAN